MKEVFAWVFGGGALVVLTGLLFLIVGPVLALWVINSLAESGGSTFYIEHNIWNYFVAFIMLVLIRGGNE